MSAVAERHRHCIFAAAAASELIFDLEVRVVHKMDAAPALGEHRHYTAAAMESVGLVALWLSTDLPVSKQKHYMQKMAHDQWETL